MVAEHHPLASRYTVLSAHCLISVLCVANVYNNNNNDYSSFCSLILSAIDLQCHVFSF